MVCTSHSCRIISVIDYILVTLTNADTFDIKDLITTGTSVQISEQLSVRFRVSSSGTRANAFLAFIN
jgi:hypothetical protein